MHDMTTQKQGDLAYKSQICKQSETKTSLLSEISVYSATATSVSLARGKRDTHKGAMGSSPTHSGKIKVNELENMQKIKAVNELRNFPRGFSKTLWGQNIAKKYGVSLKTLYAWAKVIESEEYERMHETSGVYGSGVGLVAHNSKMQCVIVVKISALVVKVPV